MTDEASEFTALTRALAAHLARREQLGSPRVARAEIRPQPARMPRAAAATREAPPREASHRPEAPASLEPVRTPPVPSDSGPDSGPGRQRSQAAACANLTELRTLVAACRACPLAETRTQTVFADGPEHARVMFLGEAPGQSEDEQGVPFVGLAGRLLTDIIEKGMGLARSEVVIANVLKCRPPGNRDPEASEKALCTPFLDRQIELVDPEILIPLGTHAAQHVLGSPLSIGQLRGRVHDWRGSDGKPRKVVPTYHPAYLLREPSMKKACWQDIQLAMRELGLK